MKTLLFFLTISSYAQSLSPTLSEPFSYPGSSFVLSVVYTNSNTTSPPISSLGWTVSVPAGFTMGNPIPGAASIAAGKTISCTAGVCATAGSLNTYGVGVVANIPISLSTSTALGSQQISLINPLASTAAGVPVTTTAGPPVSIQINVSSGTTPWFSATVGPTTCRASKVAQTPMRISWVCFNPYGTNAGSYTADLFNGGNGTAFFNMGIASISAPASTAQDGNLFCQVQVNATQNSQTMLGGVLVPANSAAYNCSGYSTSGSGTLTWP